jgi:hypothetical protein
MGYSIVIIPQGGGCVSRDQGNVTEAVAVARAKERRLDFPTATEVRVIQHGVGVIHSF